MLGGFLPDSVNEFRNQVPLTCYGDYYSDLLNRRTDTLPAKPVKWISGLGVYEEYPTKLIPVTERCWEELEYAAAAAIIFAISKRPGQISRECYKTLLNMVKTMSAFNNVESQSIGAMDLLLLPYLHICDSLPMEEHLRRNYELSLQDGACVALGKAWLLAATGQNFEFSLGELKYLSRAGSYHSWLRLLKGIIRSRMSGRSLAPRDLWKINAIIATGSDRIYYRDKIHRNWGAIPLHIYGNAESLITAMQTWDRSSLTFLPNLNFLEFISEREYCKWIKDRYYQPETVLLDEVTAGESYELVITNFHGGILVRYRTGDIIRITAPCDRRYGIETPQMVYERKIDDIIDLGYMYITERALEDAVENTHIPCENWTARKEMHDQKPVLHIYIELKENYIASETGMAAAVYKQIKKINYGCMSRDISSLEKLTGISPVKVTLLPAQAFHNYTQRCFEEGIAEAPLAPPRINPTDKMLSLLGAKAKAIAEIKDSIKSHA